MGNRRIFVVEAESPPREELVRMLSQSRAEIYACAAAEDFLAQVDADLPTCLVMGFDLPGMSALDLLAHLREKRLRLPSIVISAHGSVPLTVEAMRRGAEMVFEAPVEPAELAREVQRCLTEDARKAPQRRRARDVRERLGSVSEGEREVLLALLNGKGNKTIATELAIGQRTVEARRARLFEKLGADSLAQLVRDVVVAAELDPAVAAMLGL